MYNYSLLDSTKCEYLVVCPLEELPPGERLFVEIDRQQIVIFNLGGQLYAIEDVCSHDDGPVGEGTLEGTTVVCPRHGARFDIRSGQALALPAVRDIPAYPLRVVDGQIEIGLPV